jgi:hypothetical protein
VLLLLCLLKLLKIVQFFEEQIEATSVDEFQGFYHFNFEDDAASFSDKQIKLTSTHSPSLFLPVRHSLHIEK